MVRSKSGASEGEECMLDRSPRSEIQCDASTCLCLQLFLEPCTRLQKAKVPPKGPVGGWPTSCWCGRPPADHFLLLQGRKSGRPDSFSGWQTSCCCISPVCCNREQERTWQCICKICVHNHTPYHVMNSRECCISPLGPPIVQSHA